MALIDIKTLLDSGVHLGHNKKKWNPEVSKYIYGIRDDIHIINLEYTVVLLRRALRFVNKIAYNHGTLLFVATDDTTSNVMKSAAILCNQPYINGKWLGGTLTNYTVLINKLHKLIENNQIYDKKHYKFYKYYKALINTKKLPDALFIINPNKNSLPIKEAIKMNIPIISVLDTNSSNSGIMYPIPGNDDSIQSINLYCQLIAKSFINGRDISIDK